MAKPILFSFSFAALFWAMSWLLDRLPPRRLAWIIAIPFAITSVLEVGLISMQTWRGRASHFNNETFGDELLFIIMGALVVVISLAIVATFVWSLVEQPESRHDRLAAYAGFALVLSGLGVGQWLVTLGSAFVQQQGFVPDRVVNGAAGVVSYPHGVAFHGIHVFMVTLALASALGMPAGSTTRLLRLTVIAYGGVMGIALTQAVVGRSITDLGAASVGFALVSAVSGTLATLARGVVDRRRVQRDERVELLTLREREVLVAMANGWSNGEISERLFIAENTVKTHVKRVLMKLAARDRVHAVVLAYRSGLMDDR